MIVDKIRGSFLLDTLFFVFFILLFCSKWFINVGVRIGYFIPVYYAIAVLLILTPRFFKWQANAYIIKAWAIKMAFLVPVILSIIPMLLNNIAGELYYKGIFFYCVLYLPLVLVLVYINNLSAEQGRVYLKLFFRAIVFILAFSFAEQILQYAIGFDLSGYISTIIPAGEGEISSIDDDKFGITGILFYRSSALSGDPSQAGLTFLFGYILADKQSEALGLKHKTRWKLVFFLGILITYSASIILTYVIYLLYKFFKDLSIKKIAITAVVILVIAFLAITYIQEGTVLYAILEYRFNPAGTASGHASLNKQVLDMSFSSPFGIGFNLLSIYAPEIYSAHNSLLQVLVETGVLGVLFVLAWVAYVYFIARYKRSFLSETFCIVLLLSLISSMSHDIFSKFDVQFFLFFLLALSTNSNFLISDSNETK